MKIAYVTTWESSDVHAWSGLGSYVLRALQGVGFQTESIDKLSGRVTSRCQSVLKKAYYRLLSRNYLTDREPTVLMDYSTQVERRLASIDHDVVFSPSTIPLSHLRTEKPVVFWTDATFAGLLDFYPGFSNLCQETIANGNRMEQLALTKCQIAIYSSEWAAATAIENYDVDPNKVKVVPFGANVSCNRSIDDISQLAQRKSLDTCKLLFLGVDWYRKGGDLALAVTEELIRRGTPTELHVAGCDLPQRAPAFVKHHGFISKKTASGNERLEKLFRESHFLILPTRADCVPVVFAEASSFGLPTLTTQVGGISTAIRNGKNGRTFALDSDPAEYCDYIERLVSSRQEYEVLALASYKEYATRLNWSSAGSSVRDLITQYCA